MYGIKKHKIRTKKYDIKLYPYIYNFALLIIYKKNFFVIIIFCSL